MQEIGTKDLFPTKQNTIKNQANMGHPKLKSMFDKKISNSVGISDLFGKTMALDGGNEEKTNFEDILIGQMQSDKADKTDIAVQFEKGQSLEGLEKLNPKMKGIRSDKLTLNKSLDEIIKKMEALENKSAGNEAGGDLFLEQGNNIKYGEDTLKTIKNTLDEIALRQSKETHKNFFIPKAELKEQNTGKLSLTDILKNNQLSNESLIKELNSAPNPLSNSTTQIENQKLINVDNAQMKNLSNRPDLNPELMKQNLSPLSLKELNVFDNKKKNGIQLNQDVEEKTLAKKSDIDFDRIQMELSKSVPLNHNIGKDVMAAKTQDISYLGNNTQNIITKIENYIAQAAVANEKSMGIVFQHDKLGAIGLNVEKGAGNELKVSILTMNKDSNEFFMTTKNHLVQNLASNGINVTDFKVERHGMSHVDFSQNIQAPQIVQNVAPNNSSIFGQLNNNTQGNGYSSNNPNTNQNSSQNSNSFQQQYQQNERDFQHGQQDKRKAMWEYYQNKEYV